MLWITLKKNKKQAVIYLAACFLFFTGMLRYHNKTFKIEVLRQKKADQVQTDRRRGAGMPAYQVSVNSF